MKKSWIYTLCLLCLFACTKNNSVNSFEEDGNDCSLTISTSVLSCGDPMPVSFSKAIQPGKPVFSDDLPDNSKIGLCVYRSGSFAPIAVNTDFPEQQAENILSQKNNNHWHNSADILLRQPSNVYAYFPYDSENFIAGKANNPTISSDDVAPKIKIKPGSKSFLYGKAEKNGNGLLDVITPVNNNAAIRFNYAMALIAIRIKGSNDLNLNNLSKVKFGGVASEALLSLEDGAISAVDSTTSLCDIELLKNDNISSPDKGYSFFQIYVIPQKIDNSVICSLFFDKKEYQFDLKKTACKEWVSGSAYIYTISLDKDENIIIEAINSYNL